MEIVYAAEKDSIANLLADYIRTPVAPGDIEIHENPVETGSFRIDWRWRRFFLTPDGEISARLRVRD